ncbi:hypothetical protein ATE84_1655 [Aquimarina sp. MAR_2010_214]|uniref:hypothetical protein n=1 Tax=Aquimarina sp. MAR_2010_214 TaxID=1250026 RepID=UPI000C7111CC|nr:hypothetical protein [Aquimarina sp. MAR_2010_214]PKV49621.1 hypothetical protein ATE84_1655 [Aquimarina sp. MAR_2010_214]
MIFYKINLFIFIFFGYTSFSQSYNSKNIYNAYDELVSIENTGLYNGVEFKDPYLNTDGSYRYFGHFNFTKGTIIYNNQFYANVLLKYDVLHDNVITKSNNTFSYFNIKLISENISAFSIYGHNFIKLTDTKLNRTDHIFFEILYIGNTIHLYTKHIKKKNRAIVNKRFQYRFKKDNLYLLFYNDAYYPIDSIKDLNKIFPKNKKQINNFYKSYKSIYKSNRKRFMIEFVKYLNGTLENLNE